MVLNWHKANKPQLLQIALSENCPMDFKYRAVAELQMRWSEDMLTETVIMYGKGYAPVEIANYLGISPEMVGSIVSKYGLRKAKVGFTTLKNIKEF